MKKLISLALAAVLCMSLLSACTGGTDQDQAPDPVDLAAFAQQLQENHELSGFLDRMDPEDAEFGALMLDNNLPGLRDLDLAQVEIYMSMISFSSGEFSLVEAKNAEDAAKVKEIFQARIDAKSTDGPGNYPMESEMWQNSSALVQNGNYLMLVCAEDCDAIVNEFNALFEG